MKGFFNNENNETTKLNDAQLKEITNQKKSKNCCEKCGLFKNCKSPKMSYMGQGKQKYLIIGDCPDIGDDRKNQPFTGVLYQFLSDIFEEHNIDIEKDCWLMNSVSCHTKKISNTHIKYCREHLFAIIEELKPKKILCLGVHALKSIIGEKQSVTSIEKWLRWIIPDQDLCCFIAATYYPDYNTIINNNYKYIAKKNEFMKNIADFFEHDKKFQKITYKYDLYINDHVTTLTELDKIKNGDVIIFDYETTGLKPYNDGHEILCVSISIYNNIYVDGIQNSFCFNLSDEKVRKKWINICKNEKIKKIAQNLKFEHIWTKIILKTDIVGWIWDTQLATHINDNRSYITGLKFQTYAQLGISGYEDDTKKYIKANENGFNELQKMDQNKLYTYCVQDSIFTNYIYQIQLKETKCVEALNFFLNGTIETAYIEMNGWKSDIMYYKKMAHRLDIKLNVIDRKIKKTNAYKLWKSEKNQGLNINSSKDLRELFFSIMKLESVKKTKTNNDSVDFEALTKMNNKLSELIVQDRKIRKIKKTYIENFIDETNDDGKIHPSYNLGSVRTYRGSSSNPNMQNVPKRDQNTGEMIRTGIIPSKNHCILEVDYSGLEVRISTCYHKDPVMIKYLQGHGDMHKDTASELFNIPVNEITKNQRYIAKNCFVFAEFYGSYFEDCAKNIWEKIDVDTKEILKKQGYCTLQQYTDHVENVEYNFWNKKFKKYNKWKKSTYNNYLKNGIIYSKTGFQYEGVMNKNDVLNYAIQGSAFHCLLYSLISINRKIREKKYKSKIIGQIHDSLIFEIYISELPQMKSLIEYVMTQEIREYWDWIIVPLDVEMEISYDNWYNMEVLQ